MLAGVGAGLFGSLEEAAAMRGDGAAVRAGDGAKARAPRGWRAGRGGAAVLRAESGLARSGAQVLCNSAA